jgi:hypothetical protein
LAFVPAAADSSQGEEVRLRWDVAHQDDSDSVNRGLGHRQVEIPELGHQVEDPEQGLQVENPEQGLLLRGAHRQVHWDAEKNPGATLGGRWA